MDDREYDAQLDELDHLMNDPESPMLPSRVWDLLAQVSFHDLHPDAQPA